MKNSIILILAIIVTNLSFSQDKPRIYDKLFVGIEANSTWIRGDISDKWAVRQDVETHNYNSNNHISSSSNIFYFGIKPEYFFANNKLSISSGLKYSQINGKLYNDVFFHLRYRKEGNNTEFVRIKDIYEKHHYLGIPIEAKLSLINYEEVSFFVKAGIDFNMRISTKTGITFFSDYMSEFESDVLETVGISTNSFFSTLYYSVGMRLLSLNKIHFNIEGILPSIILTNKNSSIMNPDSFVGLTGSIVIPINILTK
jgi:hypothetical protein